MNLLRAVQTSLVTLAALTMCACARPGSPPGASVVKPGTSVAEPTRSVAEPTNSVSRIRVVNDSSTALSDLQLFFPKDQVSMGDVAAGATSSYVEVPHGVYGYSAFGFLRDGKAVVQPVVDFVGEAPLPIDDYTYVLGVDPESDHPIELIKVVGTPRG